MLVRLLSTILILLALAWSSPPVGAGESGPTVFVAPDDVTPLRRSDDTSLFRPHRVPPDGDARLLERRLEHDLERLPSRTVARPEGKIPERRLGRDLDASEQRLRTLKTRRPNASSLPLLERRLERLQRPTRLGQ